MSYIDDYRNRVNRLGSSNRDRAINAQKKSIKNNFKTNPSYALVDAYLPSTPLSSTPLDCWIVDDSDVKDQKKIIAYPDSELDKGYLMYWRDKNSYWLLTQADPNFGDVYSRGTMLECFTSLKWLDSDGSTVREAYFCYGAINSSIGVDKGDILILPTDHKQIFIQANEYTNNIKTDQRFIFDKQGWKVTSLDGVVNGLVKITLAKDQINAATDNINLRIADYYKNVNDYEIEVSNTITSLEQGSTYQILAKVFNHDIEVTSATPIYVSSDTDIMSVSSGGLVTGVFVGTANITISYGGVDKVLPIEIQSTSVTNNYAVFDTAPTIFTNQSKTFNVHYENNGVTVMDTSTFNIFASDGVSSTNLASITSQSSSGNSCVLKASGNIGTFVLKVTNDDSTITKSLSVEIKSVL